MSTVPIHGSKFTYQPSPPVAGNISDKTFRPLLRLPSFVGRHLRVYGIKI